MSLTLRSVLTAGLLLLGFQAAAQDIPQAFQGKWAGRYEGKNLIHYIMYTDYWRN